MRYLALLGLVLVGFLLLRGRDSHGARPGPVAHALELAPGAPLQLSLRGGGLRLLVPEGEAASIGSLQLDLPDGESLAVERDGTPEVLWEADLEADEVDELVLACRSAGSGSHLALTLLRRDPRGGWIAAPLPPLVERSGHLGHKQLRIRAAATGDQVELEYPVYLPDDSNYRPTGGHARTVLDLETESWH